MIQDGPEGRGKPYLYISNYIGGTWRRSRSSEFLDVRNPATAETMVRVPLTSRDEVGEAVQAAQGAFADWRRTPPSESARFFRLEGKLLRRYACPGARCCRILHAKEGCR